MSRVAVLSTLGYVLAHAALGAAQPASISAAESTPALTPPEATAAPAASLQAPVVPGAAADSEHPLPPVSPAPSAPSPSADLPAPGPAAAASVQPETAATPAAPPAPRPALRIAFLQPTQPAAQKPERDRRKVILGVGPLLLANVHWLDQLSDASVSVNGRSGSDARYPGFAGMDVAPGIMLDLRYEHFIGVEVDLFWQNDRGTGTITVKDAGSLCLIPGRPIPYLTSVYDVTIGQYALHLPVLFKLSIPSRWHTVHDGDREREIKKGYATFAFGPEFVFPGDATLSVAPGGLDYPLRATASNYLMYTGAFGAERRLSDSTDLRLIASLRGSYNPSIGGSAMKRGQYDVVDGNIVPIAYKSEWRYQAALTLGLGWFF